MGKTAVEICNMAIGRLGISQFIASLETEQSNEARVCRVFFDNTRDRVLQEMPWNFATRFATLQDIGTPPDGWTYRYRYPNDCLQARKVARDITVQGVPFSVIEDETGGGLAICTNQGNAVLVYTARITNTNLYSMLFVDVLAWALAAEIAAPLSAVPKMATAAGEAYMGSMLRAAARNMNEGQEAPEPETEFLTSRL
jgi:hypothetical protein